MLVKCPNPECKWTADGIHGEIVCPSCGLIFKVGDDGYVSTVRTLVLRGSGSYFYRRVSRFKNKPFQCRDDLEYAYLVNTGQFEEIPPIGFRYVQYHGHTRESIDVRSGGTHSNWSPGEKRLVSRFEYERLMRSRSFHVISNRSILKELVESFDEVNYLVIRDMGLGDCLMVSDAIQSLHRQYPSVKVTFATNKQYNDVFAGNPHISKIIAINEMGYEDDYQMVCNLCRVAESSEKRTEWHRTKIFADAMGIDIPEDGHETKIYLGDKEISSGRELLLSRYNGNMPKKTWIGIQTHGSTAQRTWPIEYCKTAIDMLVRGGNNVAIFGDHEFRWDGANVANFTRNINQGIGCRDLATIISNLDLIITPDSGLYHVAEGVGTHSIPIFSSIIPDLRTRYYTKCHYIWHKETCGPCWDGGCNNEYACLKSITPEIVMRKVNEVLSEITGKKRVVLKRKRKVVAHA
jgi:ADP-heptose:LPS heptosyltransferase